MTDGACPVAKMKLLPCFFVLIVTIASAAQTADQIEHKRLQALQIGDYHLVEHLLAPQFVMTRPDGSVLDRSEFAACDAH